MIVAVVAKVVQSLQLSTVFTVQDFVQAWHMVLIHMSVAIHVIYRNGLTRDEAQNAVW